MVEGDEGIYEGFYFFKSPFFWSVMSRHRGRMYNFFPQNFLPRTGTFHVSLFGFAICPVYIERLAPNDSVPPSSGDWLSPSVPLDSWSVHSEGT